MTTTTNDTRLFVKTWDQFLEAREEMIANAEYEWLNNGGIDRDLQNAEVSVLAMQLIQGEAVEDAAESHDDIFEDRAQILQVIDILQSFLKSNKEPFREVEMAADTRVYVLRAITDLMDALEDAE